MNKRSYHQFCPLAYSLDVIGERWTLLLIRELLFGPRRFTDLLNDLPGIGTNLLSKRLKELEEAGLIQQRYLPPPAASAVYELTPRGRDLQPVITALAQWGLPYITMPPPEDHFIGVIQTMGAIKLMFNPAANAELICEIHTQSEVFTLHIEGGSLQLLQGSLNAQAPDLILEGDPHPLLSVIGSKLPLQQALDQGQIILKKGDLEQMQSLIACFYFPG